MSDNATEDKSTEEVKSPVEETQPTSPTNPMADPLAAASGWVNAGTSWGASWLSSAKQKTMDTLQLVKKDLDEFTETVTTEAKSFNVFTGSEKDRTSQTPSTVATPETETEKEKPSTGDAIEAQLEKMTNVGYNWMKNLVNTVQSFGIEDTTQDEDDLTETIRPKSVRNSCLPKIRLMELQTSEDTYLEAPTDTKEYDLFAEHFSLSEHDGEINTLLSINPPMRALFSSLVPEKVDNNTFWMRYFFKLELAEDMETKTPISKEIIPDSLKPEAIKDEPTSPAHSTDDWSVCSPGDGEIQEIETETSTPTPPESVETEKKGEGWVDWDE